MIPHPLFFISATVLVMSCFFCCIILWVFSKNSQPKKVLGFTLLVATLYNLYFQFKVFQAQTDRGITEILDFSYSLFCLFVVYAAFLYFRILMQKTKASHKRIVQELIVTLAAFCLLYLIIIIANPQPVSLYTFESLKENIGEPVVWLRIIVYLYYILALIRLCVLTIKLYRKHKKEIELQFSYQEDISLSWIPFLVGVFIVDGLNTLIDIAIPKSGIDTHIIFNFVYSLFYLIIGFLGASQKDIYSSMELAAIKQENMGTIKPSYIPESTHIQLKNNLKALMENDKIYLNPELRLDTVIKLLGTNRTYLFLIIKEDFGDNFIGLVNRYRIEEAKQLISNENTRENLSEIATKVGFKSISSFNIFFKRFTNQTPTEFKKFCLKKNEKL